MKYQRPRHRSASAKKLHVGTCDACEKRIYVNKKAAKAMARQLDRIDAYRCEDGHWHVGHLPSAVKRGEQARADILTAQDRRRSA